MPGPGDEQHFVWGLRTSTAKNTTAYGFSLVVAGSFAALTKAHGQPTWLDLLLFLAGSCGGFAAVNALSTHPEGVAGRAGARDLARHLS